MEWQLLKLPFPNYNKKILKGRDRISTFFIFVKSGVKTPLFVFRLEYPDTP